MMKELYIIAAGLSSRMGGSPKHLCMIGGTTNLENTVSLAYPYFEKIVVVLNKDLKDEYKQLNASIVSKYKEKVMTIEIESGKGDLHAINEAIKNTEDYDSDIYCIWGDTYFKDDSLFKAMYAQGRPMRKDACIGVFCALEENPYAYVISSGDVVLKSGFRNENESKCGLLLHDQSAFRINPKLTAYCFDRYDDFLKSTIKNIYRVAKTKKIEYEFSIIKFIGCINEITDFVSIIYMLDKSVGYSFNTEEELEKLNTMISK